MNAAAQFRAEADKRYGERRQRTRYPEKLKALALDHTESILRSGGSLTDAAKDLGIEANSLRKWRKKHQATAVGGPRRRESTKALISFGVVLEGHGWRALTLGPFRGSIGRRDPSVG